VACMSRIGALSAVGSALALLLVAGCSSTDESTGVKKPAAAAPAATRSQEDELVAAVAATGGTAPVALRFEIPRRPAPGASFALRLRATASGDVDRLQASLAPAAGLELVGGASAISFGALQAGQSADRTIQLRATSEGVFELSVRLTTTGGTTKASGTTEFAIPLIVPAIPTAPK
jgi:hypothetical protein